MNAIKKSLGHIFDPTLRLVVPLFQRPYVWKQETNLLPLWESIQEVAERRLSNNPRPHFMGAIVLDQMQVSTGDIDTRQIIDGQQRMTTFQLVLTALRDRSKAAGNDAYFKAFGKLTQNDVPFSKDEDEVFKIWPTNADRNHFRSVLNAGSPDAVRSSFNLKKKASGSIQNNLIPHAYLYFYDVLSEWLGPSTEPTFIERLKVLWQSLKDDMQVVVIDLDDDDDAQVIFETLNALGTPLLPADLVKNFLFQSADLKNENIEKLYETYWKPFDQDSAFWRDEVRQGRLKRPRIDLFLQHYLTLMKGDEVPATHLFSEFRDLARKRPAITAKDHLQSIHRYGEIFKTFMSGFSPNSPEGRFFSRLNELDTTTVFPVLLEVFERAGGHPSEEVRTVLSDLESFLVRRMICGLTTKNYNLLMRSLVQNLQSNDTFSAKAVRNFLLAQDAESTRWPGNEEFEKAWLNRPIYEGLTRARVRIVLEALELEMYTEKTEKITIDSKLTIEHVLPQEWETHWPLPAEPAIDEATKRRDHLLHTIGNLTLVTESLNPAMSNGPWASKKAALSEHTALAMNRKLIALQEWNDAAIETRSQALFVLATKIWPRPNSLNGSFATVKETHQIIANQPLVESSVEDDGDESIGDEPNANITSATSASNKPVKEHTKFDVTISGVKQAALPRHRAMLVIVKHMCDHGVKPDEIAELVPWRTMFISIDGTVSSEDFVTQQPSVIGANGKHKYFCDQGELIHCSNRTYALSNVWGGRAFEAIQNILAKFPDKGLTCEKQGL